MQTCRASWTVPSPPTVTSASQAARSRFFTISLAWPGLLVSHTLKLKPAALKMLWISGLWNMALDLHCSQAGMLQLLRPVYGCANYQLLWSNVVINT